MSICVFEILVINNPHNCLDPNILSKLGYFFYLYIMRTIGIGWFNPAEFFVF